VLRAAARASVRRADAVVFVSDAFRGVAEPHLPASSARRHTVTVGIDARFSPDGGADRFEAFRPYVLAVSDVYRYKSLPLAVDAFAALAHERPSLRLVLAGRAQDAVESARIDERIEHHALQHRVLRLGSVEHDEMPALYRGASCFVFPSTLESLGLPPLEALACGVPVVAAHASVMPDVLDGAAAFFAPGDAAAAVAALRGALDGGGQDAQARRDVLARHDPAVVGAALAAVFRETARQ
jgi:glycosyltransferase involved in cell wall biosynthesis